MPSENGMAWGAALFYTGRAWAELWSAPALAAGGWMRRTARPPLYRLIWLVFHLTTDIKKTVRIKISEPQYVLIAPFVPGEESPSCLPTQSETHIYRRGQWILYIQSGHCPHSCIAPKEYTEHWMRYATAFFLLSAA